MTYEFYFIQSQITSLNTRMDSVEIDIRESKEISREAYIAARNAERSSASAAYAMQLMGIKLENLFKKARLK